MVSLGLVTPTRTQIDALSPRLLYRQNGVSVMMLYFIHCSHRQPTPPASRLQPVAKATQPSPSHTPLPYLSFPPALESLNSCTLPLSLSILHLVLSTPFLHPLHSFLPLSSSIDILLFRSLPSLSARYSSQPHLSAPSELIIDCDSRLMMRKYMYGGMNLCVCVSGGGGVGGGVKARDGVCVSPFILESCHF